MSCDSNGRVTKRKGGHTNPPFPPREPHDEAHNIKEQAMPTTDSPKPQQTAQDTLQAALLEISNQAAAAFFARNMDDALDMLQHCGRIADEALEKITISFKAPEGPLPEIVSQDFKYRVLPPPPEYLTADDFERCTDASGLKGFRAKRTGIVTQEAIAAAAKKLYGIG